MIGPFKKDQGGYTHILAAIDKFMKWIEYKPIASLTSAKIVEFIQEIMFRFGKPDSIITDLGSNFTNSEFFDFYKQRSIQIKYASVAHPKANGHVERVNEMILDALRKRCLTRAKSSQENGSGNYRMWSGAYEPSRAGLYMETPHSSWYMGRRQCYQRI
jgi:transposase InsO family protein